MIDKNDLSINNGDILDIFSGGVAEKEKIKKENTDSSSKATEHNKDGIDPLPEIDEKLITKQETIIEKPDFKNQETLSELIVLVNEISRILKSELKNFVNEKLIDNMLLRSLEKMALQSFLFKNSNWNAEGNLRTDGIIDIERVIKNYANYQNEPEKIEKELINSLHILMSFRLKAIKAVFDKDKYDDFLKSFINKKNILEQGYKKSITVFFDENIFNKAIKGDE